MENASVCVVEIDTLWNVKLPKELFLLSALCRNRYIVECKGTARNSLFAGMTGRNRYIVECKAG